MAVDQLDRIFDLLQAQGDRLSKQGETLAAIAQEQRDTKERLFGVGNTPGLIPFLADGHSKLATTVGTIQADRRVDHAYVLGASMIITLAVKGFISKVFHWNF